MKGTDRKPQYDFVFVVLTYRNYHDLQEFLESVHSKVINYKIIVVNALFDEESENRIKKIAVDNNCDFISIENRGYSYGNNVGIGHCLSNYNFNYLIVSNPDIIIRDFSISNMINKNDACILAPKIETKTGKLQNPYWPFRCKISEFLVYIGYKKKNKYVAYAGFAINRVLRDFFLFKAGNTEKKVFAAHGSFVVFTRKAIELLSPVYDENMFLFAEESLLAYNAFMKKVKTIYLPQMSIHHKEDGSMKVSKISENDETRKSVVYYYEKVHHKR